MGAGGRNPAEVKLSIEGSIPTSKCNGSRFRVQAKRDVMSDDRKMSGRCEGQEVGLEDSECWKGNYTEIGGSMGGVRTIAVCRGVTGTGTLFTVLCFVSRSIA
jgi:hypothetical protein